MAIRKNIRNLNINYQTDNKNKEITNIDSTHDNQISINNYDNVNNNEVEMVDFSLNQNQDEKNYYDIQIKNNNDNIETMSKIEKQLENEYQSLKEKIENIYSLENSEVWYGNGIIMSNGERPMTPKEYESEMLGNYSQIYTDQNVVSAFYNDSSWQEKVKLYKDTYNKVFMQLTKSEKTEEEYQEQMESIKNDQIMISSSIYALKEEQDKIKIEKEEQQILESNNYLKWSKINITTEELEANYKEYQEQ